MAEEEVVESEEVEQEESEAVSSDDLKALQESMQKMEAENARLAHKLKESNKHTRLAEEKAERERMEAMEKSGDLESIKQSYEEKLKAAMDEKQSIMDSVKKEKLSSEGLRLAVKMNPISDVAANDLAKLYINDRMDIVEGQKVFLDEKGSPTAMTEQEFINGLVSSGRVSHFIKGNQASGSSAPGGKGGADHKQVTRSQFDSMDHAKRSKFVKEGGKVIDD